MIIGITGPSGSGKTWLAQQLSEHLKPSIRLSLDSYYKPQSDLALEARARANYDHPNALDIPLIAEQLTALKSGISVKYPEYDFGTHTRTGKTTDIDPAPYILVDGILLLAIQELSGLIDFSIYVDTPQEICFIRRLQRDTRERGRTTDSVIQQYLDTVRPMTQQYVIPSRERANLVVNGETLTPIQAANLALQIAKQEGVWANG